MPGDDEAEGEPAEGELDAAAAKKREANRKKRAAAKAKKLRDKQAAADGGEADAPPPAAEARRGTRCERRDAGPGRGLGMFATEAIDAGEESSVNTPALAVVFDDASGRVCGCCYAAPAEPAAVARTLDVVVIGARSEAGAPFAFGVVLDEAAAREGAKAAPGGQTAYVRDLAADGPNAEAGGRGRAGRLLIGDRILSVSGVDVAAGGVDKATAALRAATDGAKDALTIQIRMLLRYARASRGDDWAAEGSKEPVALLDSLQRNACAVPAAQVSMLSRLTRVPPPTVSALIFAIRTNACEVVRDGRKVGCALSALLGWHNHACAPNASASVDADGRVCVRTGRHVAAGEEVTISYVDQSLPLAQRRSIIKEHYGFECDCPRCADEARAELRAKMRAAKVR